MPPRTTRLLSIDVTRAITMLMMIFVNDLWTLEGIPKWLEHTAAADDGMGLADTIFPAFLFIVGLSFPYAISARQLQGKTRQQTLVYILSRSFFLSLIGVFLVNLENYSDAALLAQPVWQVLIIVGFFLIWLDYPRDMPKARKLSLQGAGVLLLVTMAILYRGEADGHMVGMRPQWWGILGLIGWSYLLSALICLFAGEKSAVLVAFLGFFHLFNIADHAGWLSFLQPLKPYVWIVGSGSMPAFTMAGVVISVIYRRMEGGAFNARFAGIIIFAGLCFLAVGFAERPFWGISKIRATPSWTAICTGISMLFFVVIAYVVDEKKKQDLFKVIKPAGTSTLTCYLLPYIHYGLYALAGISLPVFLRTGAVGILKSLAYALVIVLVAGMLEKRRLRLRI